MWIRSQDKMKLVNVESFTIREVKYEDTSFKGEWLGINPTTGKSDYKKKYYFKYFINDLGVYSTKEKALKVLDALEERLLIFSKDATKNIVTDMPEDL